MSWITGFYEAQNGVESVSQIPFAKYTHIIHFATNPGASGTVALGNISTSEADALVAAGHAAGVKVLYSMTSNTAYFGDNTASGMIDTFVSNMVAFMNAHGYDGIDLDWESSINVTQYASLITKLRAALTGGKLLTISAYGGGGSTPKAAIVAAGPDKLDQVNMMTYDQDMYTGYSWYVTATNQGSDNQPSIEQEFNDFTGAGIPASKLGIGIPFYGRHYSGVTGPKQTGGTRVGAWTNYSDLVANGMVPGTHDTTYGAEYHSDSSNFYPYTGPAQISDIVAFGQSKGIGGYMAFSLYYEYVASASGDARTPLSTALFNAVGGVAPTPQPPSITSFTASPNPVASGGSTTLSWSALGAESLSIDQGIGTVTGSSVSVSPTATTTYTLTATNAQGSVTKTVTVTVSAGVPTISSFTASPANINPGQSATLSWSTGLATSLSIDHSIGTVTGTSVTVSPTATTTYTLTATNSAGTTTKTVTVTLGAASPVVNSFSTSAGTISPGGSATLSWSTTGATGVSIDNGVGTVSGTSVSVSPTTTTTYTITASNNYGTDTSTVTIVVPGAAAENVRYHQVRRADRQGDGKQFQMFGGLNAIAKYPALYDSGGNVDGQQPRGNTTVVQMADQTAGFTENDLLAFDGKGNSKDSAVPIADLLTTSGAGGTTKGTTPGGYGSWYGQVPRGTVDGSNRTFYLDYKLLNPYTVLQLGSIRLPSVQGVPQGGFATESVPGGQYTIDGFSLTMAIAPQPGEQFYIEYFRAEPRPTPNNLMLTVTTAWTQMAGESATAQGSIYGTYATFSQIPFMQDTDSYSKRVFTADITTNAAGVTNPDTLFVSFSIYLPSTGLFDIYDVYVTGTYEDGSQSVFRPTRSYTQGVATAQMVEDPPTYQDGNAIDGDPNTCARIQGSGFWGSLESLGGFFELRVDNFVVALSTPPPTPVAPTLSTVTQQSGNYTLPANLSGQTVTYTGSSPGIFTLPSVVNAPSTPTLGQVAGGTNAATTDYAVITYVTASGETLPSPEANLAVSADNLLTIASPAAVTGATGWNAYVGPATGEETKQNFATIPIGTNWTESSSGLQASTILPPTLNTASPTSTYTGTVANTGASTLTITPPSGTTLNGSAGPITLTQGQSATIYSNGSGSYYAVTSGYSTSATTTHTETLNDSAGPITLSSGDYVYVTGVPD